MSLLNLMKEIQIACPPYSSYKNDYKQGWDAASGAILAEVSRNPKIAEMEFIPGEWVCDACGFVLIRSVMHADTGDILVNPDGTPKPCPGDGTALRRVTWEEACKEARKEFIKVADERNELKLKLDEVKSHLKTYTDAYRRMSATATQEQTRATDAEAALAEAKVKFSGYVARDDSFRSMLRREGYPCGTVDAIDPDAAVIPLLSKIKDLEEKTATQAEKLVELGMELEILKTSPKERQALRAVGIDLASPGGDQTVEVPMASIERRSGNSRLVLRRGVVEQEEKSNPVASPAEVGDALAKVRAERSAYYAAHNVCPRCHGKRFSTTNMGYIFTGADFQDKNLVMCACGWKGTIHDLVAEPKHEQA